jgi:hypothetical protein
MNLHQNVKLLRICAIKLSETYSSLITARKVSLQVLRELNPCDKLAMQHLVLHKQHHNRPTLVLWRGQGQWKEQYASMCTGACWVPQTLRAMVDSYEIIMVSSHTGFTGQLQSQVFFSRNSWLCYMV